MLVKIEDGFYLNSQHIIAVRISKNITDGCFMVGVEYTPHNTQALGIYQKLLQTKLKQKFIYKIYISKFQNKCEIKRESACICLMKCCSQHGHE